MSRTAADCDWNKFHVYYSAEEALLLYHPAIGGLSFGMRGEKTLIFFLFFLLSTIIVHGAYLRLAFLHAISVAGPARRF